MRDISKQALIALMWLTPVCAFSDKVFAAGLEDLAFFSQTELPEYNQLNNFSLYHQKYPAELKQQLASYLLPSLPGYRDGALAQALFDRPHSLAIDSQGTLYLADQERVRKIADGRVSTLPLPKGRYLIAVNSDNQLYLSLNAQLFLWTGKSLKTIAGKPYQENLKIRDGQGTAAVISPFKLAPGIQGEIYALEQHCLRKYTPQGKVTTLAGDCFESGYRDGQGKTARFHFPQNITVDQQGNIWLREDTNSSQGNHYYLRKISPTGSVSTAEKFEKPGNSFLATRPNGSLIIGAMLSPSATLSSLYLRDSDGQMQEWAPMHGVPTLAEYADNAYSDGMPLSQARRWGLSSVSDADGNIYTIADDYLVKISPDGEFLRLAGQARRARFKQPKSANYQAKNHLLITKVSDAPCGNQGSPEDIFALHPNTAEMHQITWFEEDIRYACGKDLSGGWGKENKSIWFSNHDYHLYRVNSDGTGFALLADGQNGDPSFSMPYFYKPQWWPARQVSLFHVHTRLEGGQFRTGLSQMDANGQNLGELPMTLPGNYALETNSYWNRKHLPVFFPDGKTLLVAAYKQNNPDHTVWMRLDLNTRQTQLIKFSQAGIYRGLDISPDGKKMVGILTLTADSARQHKLKCPNQACPESIVVMNANGSAITPLLGFQQNRIQNYFQTVRWSPDGSQIAVENYGLKSRVKSSIDLFSASGKWLRNLVSTNHQDKSTYHLLDW